MKRFMTPNPVAWLLKKYSTMLDPGVLVWKGPIGNALSGCIDWCSMLLGSGKSLPFNISSFFSILYKPT